MNAFFSEVELKVFLMKAIKNENWTARFDVVCHPACPPEVLAVAVRDEYWMVRCYAAQNHNCPPEALAVAIRDECIEVRHGAINNPNFDTDKIREILLK